MFPKKMAQALWKFYCEIWYHWDGLFTRSKYLRRPFTFTLRDFLHFKPYFALPLMAVLSFWSQYTPGEQEGPPYIENNKEV